MNQNFTTKQVATSDTTPETMQVEPDSALTSMLPENFEGSPFSPPKNVDDGHPQSKNAPTLDILAVVTLVLSVIYTDGQYDAWDFILACIALKLSAGRLWSRLPEATKFLPRLVAREDEDGVPPRWIARVGVALSVYVFAATFVQVLFLRGTFTPDLMDSNLVKFLVSWMVGDILQVVIAILLFLLVARFDDFLVHKER